MSAKKPKTAIVERHRYVLDWFQIDKVELDLEHTIYEFSYRFGPDWFLEAKTYTGGKWLDVLWDGRGGFNLSNPCAALVALRDQVTKFSCIGSEMQFHAALAKLLEQANKVRIQQEKIND
jgi:hypothetical protein